MGSTALSYTMMVHHKLVIFATFVYVASAVSVLSREKRQRTNEVTDFTTLTLEELCRDRHPDEYFRLTPDGDCRDVVRCDRADTFDSSLRLAGVRCPTGLAFNIEKQICDWKAKVTNCDILEKARKVLPKLVTDAPICPQDQLACGNSVCIARELFCNGEPNCEDGSDENACGPDQDPNAAPKCDLSQCTLPDCFCSADGTQIPGNLELSKLPRWSPSHSTEPSPWTMWIYMMRSSTDNDRILMDAQSKEHSLFLTNTQTIRLFRNYTVKDMRLQCLV